ncbi:MAG: hypothetical protein JJE53_00130 [Candidatus Pacebacteria bacterium]|nr:hypothetical protein [Candidatus Paceibacterota bacterium]
MKKHILSIFIIFTLFLSLPQYIEAVTNTGFIPGQIWYSKETLVEGETVNIHTAVWNGEKESFMFKVEFYDKNIILGTREVSLKSLELKDVYIPWKITAGDHIISAKIISSSINNSGTIEKITINRNTTSSDKQFIPVLVKNYLDQPLSETDALKIQIEKTSAEINNFVPEEISSTISTSFNAIDDLRGTTFIKIDEAKEEAKIELDLLKKGEGVAVSTTDKKTSVDNSTQKTNIEDAIKKPITYLKLFFLSVLSFVFGNKFVFYILLTLLVFLILRTIYRKIRNR